MPVEQIAARLDDRFRLLTGGSRAALPRHRTLRAVVDWSWGLLDDDERVLARRLAVFQAGATEESAAAVCGVDDALDGLTALAERSLVVPGRAIGCSRRSASTRSRSSTRRARWRPLARPTRTGSRALVDRAEPQLRGSEQRYWFRRLQAEKDDVIAALRWLGDSGDAHAALHLAVDLLWFWVLSGSPEEAMAWISFALAVDGRDRPDRPADRRGHHASSRR